MWPRAKNWRHYTGTKAFPESRSSRLTDAFWPRQAPIIRYGSGRPVAFCKTNRRTRRRDGSYGPGTGKAAPRARRRSLPPYRASLATLVFADVVGDIAIWNLPEIERVLAGLGLSP